MKRLLLPLVLGLVGLGAGVGAAVVLKPDPAHGPDLAQSGAPCGEPAGHDADAGHGGGHDDGHGGSSSGTVFAQLNRQFVVPVIEDGRVASMAVMSLTLEVTPNLEETVFEREPRLRDGFLRVILDHANTGGFDGTFTSNGAVDAVKARLMETARAELGDGVKDVLLLDIARQDL